MADNDNTPNVIDGTSGTDSITGTHGADIINGGAGSDTLYGGRGNDVLNGGAGSDTLNGGIGDDILDGGIGNDTLDGSTGNDTYYFSAGAGQDVIEEFDDTPGNMDTIRITGLKPSEVTLSRGRAAYPGAGSNDLLIFINDTNDSLIVRDYFRREEHFFGNPHKIEQVVFDDGTVWTATKLDAAATILPEGVFKGTPDDDAFDLADNYILFPRSPGSQNVINTTVHGGTGNDTYYFSAGAGQDVIEEFDDTPGNMDTVRITGLKPSEVTLSRGGVDAGAGEENDLLISINGTNDRLLVRDYFTDDAHKDRASRLR